MVIVGVGGTPLSGRHTVANILKTELNFTLHHLCNPGGLFDNSIGCRDLDFRISSNNPARCTEIQEVVKNVSTKWCENHVVYPISNHYQISLLSKRPQFVFLSVEANPKNRLSRFLNLLKQECSVQAFTDFLDWDANIQSFLDDENSRVAVPYCCFTRKGGTPWLNPIKVSNNGSLEKLRSILLDLRLDDRSWTVMPWNDYFMNLAFLLARRANCIKKRVGAVVVKENRVISTGYNGTAIGTLNCYAGGCSRCADANLYPQAVALDKCHCLHAETNAIVEAGRKQCCGSILYITTMPCVSCSLLIVQSGIKRVIYCESYNPGGGAAEILAKGNVELEKYNFFENDDL